MSRILIVDDEPSIRITLSAFLKSEGYDVHSVPDALKALEFLKEHPVDILVTDIIMPGMTGIELIDKLRKFQKEVRVIIMTGEPTVETAVTAVQNGASDYLAKPIRKEDFLRVVRNTAQTKALMDEKKDLEERNIEYQRNLEYMVASRTHALHKAMESIITLLSQVVEFRDPYTAGHQRRVGNLAASIAEKLNLSNEQTELIRIIGYIHDIGKITIPSEILSKPGKLSRAEFELLKGHSYSGYEMLSRVDLPPLIAEAIYQHHERFDGSGYPRALANSQIMVEAHILMVADVVEAMMSHRPYRPSLGRDVALLEIKEKSGRLYRPDVVNACLDLFKNGYEIDDEAHEVMIPV
ncbi:MAG: hypothetical protein A2Y20_10625 [Firmicutes bacterium GWF2_51_9]|nr:response regulator [Erysipelotrichaceae bacterium]OGS53062.1 MAG: hypothetical protein A2Y20_10625 [Firmicutes bacterium GWF2_51_9]OGS59462.1 MAG: hypothetical protein A2Y19_10790 [Firmicutes bacterium GWE2_51_13]HAO61477.1 two-component system response regulator [Erysipelotrichaceae bacterium]HBZ41084.1 two-component system response regulator [Erysipelotrichaceae bacterium]